VPRRPSNYQIGQSEPFKISRSKLEDFVRCPRCFVLDRREWIKPPSGPSFTLNSAVDGLLKEEFNRCREIQAVHPSVAELGYSYVPYRDERISDWQNSRTGVQYLDPDSNLLLYGAIDDLWLEPTAQTLHVVDYKTTSRMEPVTELGDAEYQNAYRRQLEIYSLLISENGLEVSPTAFWFYATARKGADSFDMALKFDPTLIPYVCDVSWIRPTLTAMKEALETPDLPSPSISCELCAFVNKRTSLTSEKSMLKGFPNPKNAA
jgi:hypothetical protein